MKIESNQGCNHRKAIPVIILTGILSYLWPALLMADDAAIYTGYSISTDAPPPLPYTDDELAAAEGGVDIALSMALHHLGIDSGSSEYGDITSAVDAFFDEAGNQDVDVQSGSYAVMYLPCMMRMVTPTHSMAIRLPPGQEFALMEAWDKTNGEGIAMEMNRRLAETSDVTGEGWNSGIIMTPDSGQDNMIGYETREYTFKSSGGLGGLGSAANSPQEAGMGTGAMAAMVSVTNEGTAWVADDVEGLDIVQDFYQTFSNQITSSQGQSSFYGGLMQNMVGMLQHGLPLYSFQTTKSKVAGKTMSSGTSENWVTGASVISRDLSECSVTTIPEGTEITYIGANGMPTTAGAGSAGSAGSDGSNGSGTQGEQSSGTVNQVEEGCDCSCEGFKKVQEMGEKGGGGSDAENMAMAMCMMECRSQFMSCAMQMSR